MLFIAPPRDADDIRAFCARFNEGIRVEYKGTFDGNVRRTLPKMVSSFANSLGGVLVVGVNTVNGVPVQPIEGFPTPDEELPLTIENICLQGINPSVIPRITVIPSDVANHTFVVIEIEGSWEAPHAIENKTRVYVRTGNAANPYEMADVDLVIELMKRRAEPAARREQIITAALRRAETEVLEERIHEEITVAPLYPRHALCPNDDVWTFLDRSRYRGGHYFPYQTLRRVEDGVASFNRSEEYSQISAYGLLLSRCLLRVGAGGQPNVILIHEVFHPLLKLLHCSRAFYASAGYRGDIEVKVTLKHIRGLRIPFIPDAHRFHEIDDFKCYQDSISVSQNSSAELLTGGLQETMQDILQQLCWSFWQSAEPFPAALLRDYVGRFIAQMNL